GGGGFGGGGRMGGGGRTSGYGSIVDAGSVLVAVLPSTSEMVVFKPGDKAYVEVAKLKVAATPTYAYPVMAGNKIIVKDQDSVSLLAVE
ncbi:MAG TPA: hypothetical protein VF796_19345, partial [Humisphaera sp.]